MKELIGGRSMSLTPSTMLELGTLAPNFTLRSFDGEEYALANMQIGKGLLVMFMCNHCPYVKHIREKLVEETKKYIELGITVVAVNSNDFAVYPDDKPELMAHDSKEFAYPFPYLVDENQEVAKAYRAACTPDFYLFGRDKKLIYRGQFDSSRPGKEEPITGFDLSSAIQQLIKGQSVSADQKPSMGCNIKWKPANAPEYFS